MRAAEFGFELDVCASDGNAKRERYFTAADDGLAQEWRGVCWMNPPYGRTIGRWMQKAFESACDGATVVCLVPARTDTRWWHEWAMFADEVRLVRGRLAFGDGRAPAPFPSAVVVFRPESGPQTLFRGWERSARGRALGGGECASVAWRASA